MQFAGDRLWELRGRTATGGESSPNGPRLTGDASVKIVQTPARYHLYTDGVERYTRLSKKPEGTLNELHRRAYCTTVPST